MKSLAQTPAMTGPGGGRARITEARWMWRRGISAGRGALAEGASSEYPGWSATESLWNPLMICSRQASDVSDVVTSLAGDFFGARAYGGVSGDARHPVTLRHPEIYTSPSGFNPARLDLSSSSINLYPNGTRHPVTRVTL